MKDINSLVTLNGIVNTILYLHQNIEEKNFMMVNGLEIAKILGELCKWKDVNIITAEVCPDHVHMFVEIPPKVSLLSFMEFLKGKSSVMMYSRWGNMKYKYINRSFLCRGYFVDTVEKNEVVIRKYIDNQLKEDRLSEQLTLDKIDLLWVAKSSFAKDRL